MSTKEQCFAIINEFDESLLDSVKEVLSNIKAIREKSLTVSEREAILARGREAVKRIQEQSVINGTSEMTLYDINFEIAESRRERRVRGEL